jgi:hypothetical protein
MNIYENKYLFIKKRYSFSLIKVQTDLKLWNNGNRVKQTPFWSIQKPERSSQSSLTTLSIS